MNTFIICQDDNKILLNFVCDNPPSSLNKYLILLTLENLKIQSLDYNIFTIVGDDKAYKFEDYNKTVDEFMDSFLKVCNGSCRFGVRLYVK